jgi:glycosyltransferase involved in cell wall biosynthesis
LYASHRIAVIVPCYRVAAFVERVVAGLPPFVDDVVIVDDGSPDALTDVVRPLIERTETPACHLVTHEINQGLAGAMRSGFEKALALGADIIVKMDGDGQMDPHQLSRLLDPVVSGEADYAKGNRFHHRRYLQGMPLARKLGNLALSFLSKAASGYWHVFDPTNGYLALRREVVEAIELDRLGPRYFFETSLLVEGYLAGAKIVDVPMPAVYRDEPSSLSLRRTLLEFPRHLVRAAVRRVLVRYFLRDFTAVSVFLVLGVPLVVFGLGFGLLHWYRNYGSGIPTPTGTIVVALLPLLVGFQLLLQALVMDVANAPLRSAWRSRRQSPGDPP